MTDKTLAFVGGGNMAASIIGGLLKAGWQETDIHVSDPAANQRELLIKRFGVICHADNEECCKNANTIILAVKPQLFQTAIDSINANVTGEKKLIISIAAGIEIKDAVRWLGRDVPFIRVMPNTPALINKGVSGLFANSLATDSHRSLADSILSAVGETVWLDREPLIDSVTGISGSGPAYYFRVMELMIEQAQLHGLNKSQAKKLVIETAVGAAMLAKESEYSPAELRQQVTSPNGTTQAALESMQSLGIEACIHGAVDAAVARSKSLSEELGAS